MGGTRDGIVSIKATCELDQDCVGAIILSSFKGEFDPSPSASTAGPISKIPAGETRNVKVGIKKAGLEYLKKHGPDKSALRDGSADRRRPRLPVSISGKLILQKP